MFSLIEKIFIPKKNNIFIVSAPSGCGKTTICKKLTSFDKNIVNSVSVTTRDPRPGERDKRDYFFISKSEFLYGIQKGEFLEWAEVLGHLYGTPRTFVEDVLRNGKDVLLSIDVQGALKLKNKIPHAVFIFLMPPSVQELKRRLQKRRTESKVEIHRRLDLAKREMGFVRNYDYVVVNDVLQDAVKNVRAIVVAERLKVKP